jgi:hypothetical protein
MTLGELEKKIKDLRIDNPKLTDDAEILLSCDSFDSYVNDISVATWSNKPRLMLHYYHECE